MQTRVAKKFIEKILPPLGIFVYVFGVMQIASYAPTAGQSMLIGLIMIAVPTLFWMLWETWQQAKREVEWENRDLINEIKGD